jgi:hypothetical protein
MHADDLVDNNIVDLGRTYWTTGEKEEKSGREKEKKRRNRKNWREGEGERERGKDG